jgi:hypothetical protein
MKLKVIDAPFVFGRSLRENKQPPSVVAGSLQSQLRSFAFISTAAKMIVILSLCFGLRARAVSAQSTTNNVVTINGVNYPYTAAGIQTAINASRSIATTTGSGGIVILPAATIYLQSTGLTIPSHICLIGGSSDSSWLDYTGSGAAITFASGTTQACLKHITVDLDGAGANAIGVNLQGNYGNNLTTSFTKIEDVRVTAGNGANQIGIDLDDNSSPQPLAAGIQFSWFDDILITNLGRPIVVSGQEGNFWKNIHITGFSSVAVSDAFASDNFWQLRVTGPSASLSGIAFQEAGQMNHINVVCDFGEGARTCINDAGGANRWHVSAISPVGTVAPDSFFQETAGFSHGIPPMFQVPGSAVTGLSPTINSPAPSCLEMGNSNGSGGANYLNFLKGTVSVTTTKPSFCP